MKILCVGDIHAKPWIVYAVAPLIEKYDKVIFLGDYVDDWQATAEDCKTTLDALMTMLWANEGKVVILRGNHDFSEYYAHKKREFMCSGFELSTHSVCRPIYAKIWDKMMTVYIAPGRIDEPWGDYWISHAGITSGWYNQWEEEWWSKLSADEKAKSSLCDTEALMAQAGGVRGGRSLNPSPIWADMRELKASPKQFINQIVGHTPVETVTCHEFRNGDGTRNKIFFCDTFSSYSDGTPYGDGSCLSLDTLTGEWEKVYLKNKE